MRLRVLLVTLAAVRVGLAETPSAAGVASEPVRAGLSDAVEVRLVTIDVTALDGRERTVPGLGKESFRLFVDGTETPIDTLDAVCGDAPEEDPRSRGFGRWATPPDLAAGTRRVVLAFDYVHLPYVICPDLHPPGPCMLHTQALDAYQDLLAAKHDIHDEEMMVVALTGGLRVEQPFTRDRAAIRAALHRMEFDVTLFAGHFEQAGESGVFAGLEALATLLRSVPGPKSVVLLTAGDGPNGAYENAFSRLATVASDAQTRFYPVDCRGLFAASSPQVASLSDAARASDREPGSTGGGGGSGLLRLASMTGGRATFGSNDFTIGYARARRDLGCRYTIGFYDRKPEEDRPRSLRVVAAAPGITVRHAGSYSFPSPGVRHRMALHAAFMVPSMFEGGGMRAAVFPLEPHDRRRWDALVAIDFPAPPAGDGKRAPAREFGAVLTKGSVVVKRFGRTVSAGADRDVETLANRRLTFLEPAVLPPGRYALTAVLSDARGDNPHTAHVELRVAEIPKGRPFLVGPIIGRSSGPDVVIHGGEDATGAPTDRVGATASFRPLLVTETDRALPLFAFSEACVPRKRSGAGPWLVKRSLATTAGAEAGAVDAASFSGRTRAALHCERWVDEIPVPRLRWGAYAFSATLREDPPGAHPPIESRSASFFLTPAPDVDHEPAPAAGALP